MSVAVIIPFYNSQKYIQKAIDSCLLQKEVTQIILVDDGSTDHSGKVIEKYLQEDQRITLLKSENNAGVSAARNKGLREVRTPYFSFLDADDFFLEDRFIEPIQVLKTDSSIDGVYEEVKSCYVDEAGKELYPEVTGLLEKVCPHELFEHLVLDKGHLSIIGCTFRSKNLSEKFSFDTNFKLGEDTDFIWRVAYKSKLVGLVGKSKVIRNVHGENAMFHSKEMLSGKVKFYEVWKSRTKEYKMTKEMRKRLRFSYAFYKSKNSFDNVLLQKMYQWLLRISEG